ncbi:Tricarboxylate transport protein; mitochondrial [Camelus dromedarius]|uniref:Tricarboxylate transport protein n=1 Tax=Camelus dromedarius TaxID=9838 RepID=A0A5N4E8N5_CAMDR|nr:Tricarboxylate transport protein; mitochondrial [Camelus dromedarius]
MFFKRSLWRGSPCASPLHASPGQRGGREEGRGDLLGLPASEASPSPGTGSLLPAARLESAQQNCIPFPTGYVDRAGAAGRGPRRGDGVWHASRSPGALALRRGLGSSPYGSSSEVALGSGLVQTRLDGTQAAVWPGCPRGRGRGGHAPTETAQAKFIHKQTSPKPQYGGFLHGVRNIRPTGPSTSHHAMRFFGRTLLRNWYRGSIAKEPLKPLITGRSRYRDGSQCLRERCSAPVLSSVPGTGGTTRTREAEAKWEAGGTAAGHTVTEEHLSDTENLHAW